MRTATGESPWSAEQQDHGNEPLHHDGDVDDLSKPAEELHERTQRLDSLQRQAVVQGCPATID